MIVKHYLSHCGEFVATSGNVDLGVKSRYHQVRRRCARCEVDHASQFRIGDGHLLIMRVSSVLVAAICYVKLG
jgi:hypothetical protein